MGGGNAQIFSRLVSSTPLTGSCPYMRNDFHAYVNFTNNNRPIGQIKYALFQFKQ